MGIFESSDISIDVLSRLSARTLRGLKWVSKRWESLISSRDFIQAQLESKVIEVSGFFYQQNYRRSNYDVEKLCYIPNKPGGARVYDTVFNFLPEEVTILGSNNGLVCCRSCLPSSDPVIYVCNPSNREYIYVEWPAACRQDTLALAFDPFQDRVNISTKFNLVKVRREMKIDMVNFHYTFEIYSSEARLWRKSKETCDCNDNLFKNKGIFIGEVLHWLTDGDRILTFNVKNELAYSISVPFPTTQFHNSIPHMCIGESDGCLHFAIIFEDGLQVWALEDCYEFQWAIKFWVSLAEMEKNNLQFLHNLPERVAEEIWHDDLIPWIDPLALKDGTLLMRVSTEIFSFNTGTKRMDKLCDIDQVGTKSIFAPTVIPYSMSLVPLG